jgi:hypothetical protein
MCITKPYARQNGQRRQCRGRREVHGHGPREGT